MGAFIQGLECAQRIHDVKKPLADVVEKHNQDSAKRLESEEVSRKKAALSEEQTTSSLSEVEQGITSGQAALKELRQEENRLMKALKLVQADIAKRSEAMKTLTGERNRLKREQTKSVERNAKRVAVYEDETSKAAKDDTLCKELTAYLVGAADVVAKSLIGWVVPFGVTASLLCLGGLTVVLTQPMSNAAAALTMLPVAVSTADFLGIDARPVVVMVTLSASLSFIAPLEPALLLIYGPGRYRFVDFLRVSGPLTLLTLIVLVILVPVFWPLGPHASTAF